MADNSWFEGDNNPGAGDLGQMHALQRNLANTAEAARTARTDLAGLKDQVTDAVWRGVAAHEFKDSISDKFLGQLQKLDASYQNAADGFATYIAAVSQIKDRSQALASRIYAAQSHYETSAANLQAWANANPQAVAGTSGSLTAPSLGSGSPLTVHFSASPAAAGASPAAAATAAAQAQQSHAALQAEVDDAWGELQLLYRQMDDLRNHDRAAADNAVTHKLDQAHDAGIKNDSGWHHFFHALSTVAKWVGVALVVVAVVALCVLAPEFGLLAALTQLTTLGGGVLAGMSMGSLLIYGGVAVSATALTGDLGQQFSDGDKPGWGRIGLDAVGIVPGLGPAGSALRQVGPRAAWVVDGLDSAIVTTKLTTAYKIENLLDKVVYSTPGIKFAGATGLLEKGVLAGDKAILTYGENRPKDFSYFTAALWGLNKSRGVWTNAATLVPSLGIPTPTELAKAGGESMLTDQGALQTRVDIATLQLTSQADAAHAHDVAANLAAGDASSFSYPSLSSYPAAVTP